MVERIFLREIAAGGYSLPEARQRRSLDRVRRKGAMVVGDPSDPTKRSARWLLSPDDSEFLTQSMQVHDVTIPPGKPHPGHGHQNEALFYIREGEGYDIHDDVRYDWSAGDFLVVHADSVHQHYSPESSKGALAIGFKAKALWFTLGLTYQARIGAYTPDDNFGPRIEWGQIWTPEVQKQNKVLRTGDLPWTNNAEGEVKEITSTANNLRISSLDLYMQRVAAGTGTVPHWHMADEAVYVLSGSGHSLHWDIEAEVAERYYAHVAKKPSKWDMRAGDLLYVPQNTIHQFVADVGEPLVLISARNRIFRQIGYDQSVYIDDVASLTS